MLKRLKAPPSAPLDYGLQSAGAIAQLAEDLCNQYVDLKTAAKGERRPDEDFAPKLKATMRCVLLNLIAQHLVGRTVGLNLNKKWYPKNADQRPAWLTYPAVRRTRDFLLLEGWIETARYGKRGSDWAEGFNTKFSPGPKLIEWLSSNPVWPWELSRDPGYDVVQLKAEKKGKRKPRIPIPDELKADAEEMQARLVTINETLLSHWADIVLKDEEFEGLQRRLRDEEAEGDDADDPAASDEEDNSDRRPIELHRRTVYRVFNNGTFKDGGRFYGGWWQGVPSRDRP